MARIIPSSYALLKYIFRRYFRVFLGFFLLYHLSVYYAYLKNDPEAATSFKISKAALPPWASQEIIRQFNTANATINSGMACRLPQLQPFHTSILEAVGVEPTPLICETERFPLIFNGVMDPTPKLIPAKCKEQLLQMDIKSCCFRQVRRAPSNGDKNDDQFIKASKECKPLSLETATEVPVNWEFVGIECNFSCYTWTCSFTRRLQLYGYRRLMDFIAFPFVSNATGKQADQIISKENEPSTKLNVMIIVLDAVSRMNFLRTLPEVHFFLTQNLGAVELEAYHKTGENTQPNVGAMLTGTAHCGARDRSVDSCPFIWKEFKSFGYRTLFAEDGTEMAIFNMDFMGFHEPPVDHYFRPFALAHGQNTAHEVRSLSPMCWGPRPASQVLMDYVEKMTIAMHRNNTPFFQFVLFGSITHEFINGPRLLLHAQLLGFLQRLEKEGVLNNTALLLVSDHGNRMDPVRTFLQGFFEERLPFGYIAVPPWFGVKYPKAYRNLRKNSKRLVTAFDIYQTLRDILNEMDGSSNQSSDGTTNLKSPGISLFRPIPMSRTCETAGIPETYCACNIKAKPVPKDALIVKSGVKYAVDMVNHIIRKAPCARVSLQKVLQADKVTAGINTSKYGETYRLILETVPGEAHFEAMLKVTHGWSRGRVEELRATGTVGRINRHKDQSWCVENTPSEASIKPFCYCYS